MFNAFCGHLISNVYRSPPVGCAYDRPKMDSLQSDRRQSQLHTLSLLYAALTRHVNNLLETQIYQIPRKVKLAQHVARIAREWYTKFQSGNLKEINLRGPRDSWKDNIKKCLKMGGGTGVIFLSIKFGRRLLCTRQ